MKYTEEKTREFIASIEMCPEGVAAMEAAGTFCDGIDEAAQKLKDSGYRDYAAWILGLKNTEAYVRLNGSIFTMGAFQIYNPLTGVHTRYVTEDEAKQALADVARQVLELHMPRAVREISNENGDTAWTACDLHTSIVVSAS